MISNTGQVLPETNGNTTITTTAAEAHSATTRTGTIHATGSSTNPPANSNNVKPSSSSLTAGDGAGANANASTSATASNSAHKIIDNRNSRSRTSHHPTIQIIGGTICNTVSPMDQMNMNMNVNVPMMMMMPPLGGAGRAPMVPEMGALLDNGMNNNNSNNNANSAGGSNEEVGAYTQVTKGITHANKSKKRLCHFPGCQRTIKSQRHCQKHGAVVKKCKVESCTKQAQGRHEGMCKRHWNDKYKPPKVKASQCRRVPRNGIGNDNGITSVLTNNQSASDAKNNATHGNNGGDKGSTNPTDKDKMLPQATQQNVQQAPTQQEGNQNQLATLTQQQKTQQQQNLGPSVYDKIIPRSVAWKSGDCDKAKAGAGKVIEDSSSTSSSVMPLVEYLRDGNNLEPGWHRKQERLVRNFRPLSSISEQLHPEEKQLILFETMLLSGTVYTHQQGISKDLAHAWGRERGFHTQLVNQMCGRRGDLSRKRRSDIGKVVSEEEKARIRKKREENVEKSKGTTKQQQESQSHPQQANLLQLDPQQQPQHQNLNSTASMVAQESSIQATLNEISQADNTSLQTSRQSQYYPDSTPVYVSQSDVRPV